MLALTHLPWVLPACHSSCPVLCPPHAIGSHALSLAVGGILNPTSRLDAGALSYGMYKHHNGSMTIMVTTMADNNNNQWLCQGHTQVLPPPLYHREAQKISTCQVLNFKEACMGVEWAVGMSK